MSSSSVLPVQALQEHMAALQAALTACLANPDVRHVHKLRTETRRVEALLMLAALVPGLPRHRKQSAALRRALRKLRRPAGSVRDLDVHRRMLATFAEDEEAQVEESPVDTAKGRDGQSGGDTEPEHPPAESAETPSPEASREDASLLSDAAAELRRHMGSQREAAAAVLVQSLREREGKTAQAWEDLLTVLEPARSLAIGGPRLRRAAASILARKELLVPGAIVTLKEDDLHTVRKAAKAARYVAELLPADPATAKAASRYEALQEAGGQWHDALEIARAARRHFGKEHRLTMAYRQQRDSHLLAYQAALENSVRGRRPLRTRSPKSSASRPHVSLETPRERAGRPGKALISGTALPKGNEHPVRDTL